MSFEKNMVCIRLNLEIGVYSVLIFFRRSLCSFVFHFYVYHNSVEHVSQWVHQLIIPEANFRLLFFSLI
ncbi:hypothetical protein Bca4012_050355 [Brassica carinata]